MHESQVRYMSARTERVNRKKSQSDLTVSSRTLERRAFKLQLCIFVRTKLTRLFYTPFRIHPPFHPLPSFSAFRDYNSLGFGRRVTRRFVKGNRIKRKRVHIGHAQYNPLIFFYTFALRSCNSLQILQ